MRQLIKISCVLVVIVLCVSAAKDPCDTYNEYVITINEGDQPYWYQMSVGVCIDGQKVPEIPARKIRLKNQYTTNLVSVANFPILEAVFLDDINLENIPMFYNIPKLVTISLSRNKLTHINNKVFSKTAAKVLIFSTNNITSIEKGSFGEDVESIFLTCNQLESLSRDWFKNPQKIKRMNLGGNKLTAVPDNMFKDFISLEALELRNNQIKTLGVNSIAGPTSMSILHLAYNNISEIKPDVFGPKINITSFDIQYNRLSFLHQAMMDKMTVKLVNTWGNPWQCPCQPLIDAWIAKHNKEFSLGLTRDEDPSCVTALSFRNVCVPFPDDELYEAFLQTFETYPVKFC